MRSVMMEASRRIAMKMKTRVMMSTLKRRQKRLKRRNGTKAKETLMAVRSRLPSPYVDADPDVEHDASAKDKANNSDATPSTLSIPISQSLSAFRSIRSLPSPPASSSSSPAAVPGAGPGTLLPIASHS
jgi:hypothetical protein